VLTEKRSLKDFVGGQGCWVCGLPERDEIDAAFNDIPRLGAVNIVKWLIAEKGYDPDSIPTKSLEGHKRNGHHK